MSARRTAPLIALLLGLLAAAGARGETPLGRLFFTPSERAALDRNEPPAETARALPRVDGIVQRKGAPPTVWIDGQPRRDVPADTRRARVVGPDGQPVWRTVGAAGEDEAQPSIRIRRHTR